MAPHSRTLAWKIPWMEELGRMQSMLKVGHDWGTSLSLFSFMHWRRKWQPTPVFLPGESHGGEAWWAAAYGVAQSWTRLKWLSSSVTNTFTFILFKPPLTILALLYNYWQDDPFLIPQILCLSLSLIVKKKKKEEISIPCKFFLDLSTIFNKIKVNLAFQPWHLVEEAMETLLLSTTALSTIIK